MLNCIPKESTRVCYDDCNVRLMTEVSNALLLCQ